MNFSKMLKRTSLFLLLLLGCHISMAQKMPIPEIPLQRERGDVVRTVRNQINYDSIRVGITGRGDTFLVQYFDYSRHLVAQRWRNDSLVEYDARQTVMAKYFHLQ